MLDIGEAMLLEPLMGHPEELAKFRAETLYAPLEGSRAAKKRAQAAALASSGIDINALQVGMKLGGQPRRLAAAAAAKDDDKEG